MSTVLKGKVEGKRNRRWVTTALSGNIRNLRKWLDLVNIEKVRGNL